MFFLFTALTIVFFIIATNKNWRKNISWGKSGDTPMSILGYFAWIITFSISSLASFEVLSFGWVFPAFVFVIFAAIVDSWYFSKKFPKSKKKI